MNHDSDSPDKAFGIILDAVFHRYIKPAYVEILAAIDKEVAEQKHPGLIHKVVNGIINATSMSVLCESARCGFCGNLAYNEATLCSHMKPGSPNYAKGRKQPDGSIIFEDNYGLTFTEDSLVNVPADPTAHIFQIFASQHK